MTKVSEISSLISSTLDELLSSSGEDLEARECRMDFTKFSERILGFTNQPFHQELLGIVNTQPRRLLVLLPRGCGKSTIFDVQYPLWQLTRNRDTRIIIVSHAQAQAAEYLRQTEHIIQTNARLSKLYGSLKPDTRKITWTDTEKIVAGRTIQATHLSLLALGVHGSVLNRRSDLIVCDDIINSENSTTDTQRRKLSDWFWKELLPVLEPSGQLIVSGTRFHDDDIYSEIMRKGWRTFHRSILDENGNSIWEDRFPLSELQDRKSNMGSIIFNMQYMNLIDLSGSRLKPDWLRLASEIPDNLVIFQGVDPSVSSSKDADFMCIATIGLDTERKKLYLLDITRARASLLRQVEIIRDTAAFWKPRLIAIETNAAQALLKEYLESFTLLPVKALPTQRDKESRIITISALFESGRILLRSKLTTRGLEPADSLLPFISEWLAFPSGKNDDCLPAGTLIRTSRGMIPIEQVNIGDMVLTHRGLYRKVTDVGSRFADKVFEIEAFGRPSIKLTGNHRLIGCRQSERKWRKPLVWGEPEWIKIDGYSLQDWSTASVVPVEIADKNAVDLLEFCSRSYEEKDGKLEAGIYSRGNGKNTRRRNPKQNTLNRFIPVDSDFCQLMGYFLAEGSAGRHNISFVSHIREEPIRQWLLSYLRLLGLKPCVLGSGNKRIVSAGSIPLRNLFRSFGKSSEKRLPHWTSSLPAYKQLSIISGYLLGDGCFTDGSVKVSSVSATAAFQVYEMMLRQGWAACIKFNPRLRWGKPQWSLAVNGSMAENLKSSLSPDLLKGKTVGLRVVRFTDRKRVVLQNGYLLGKINRVTPIEHNDRVYNLEVEEDHSYVARGTVVHNCLDATELALHIAIYSGPPPALAQADQEPPSMIAYPRRIVIPRLFRREI